MIPLTEGCMAPSMHCLTLQRRFASGASPKGCHPWPRAYGGAKVGARRRRRKVDAMKHYALAVPLLCLAACNSEPDVKMENASVGEVAAEMRKQGGDDTFVNPGKWQQTVTLLDIEAPGMPPEARQMMQQAMDK